jgi:hypothetical protein
MDLTPVRVYRFGNKKSEGIAGYAVGVLLRLLGASDKIMRSLPMRSTHSDRIL